MSKIIFAKNLFDSLNEFLFSDTAKENGCFLLGNPFNVNNDCGIIITDIIKPKKNSWNVKGKRSLQPTSVYINESLMKAEQNNSSLIFVHTHPNPLHPSGFSFIDEQSNERLFKNIGQILDNVPLGSLVFSRHGVCGVLYNNKKIIPLDKISVNGIVRQDFISNSTSNTIESQYDRQTKAISESAQTTLQNLTISIVGVGGTGSPLSVQLARMGVQKLQLFDDDVVEITNIPRIYGSNHDDLGKAKVNVLKNHIQQFSNCDILSIKKNVVKENVLNELIQSDIIFVCTDNHSSRSFLNDVSVQYLIPLIDVGCRITLDHNAVNQSIAKIQLVTSETACLWCSGTLNGINITHESLSNDEKKKLKDDGYYKPIEEQPSVISLTTLASSLAISKLLNHLGVFGNKFETRTQLELKDSFLLNDTPKLKDTCVCNERRQLADKRKVFRGSNQNEFSKNNF